MATDATRDPLGDESLAAAYQARVAPGSHLSESEWERLICEEMSGADRDRALAHVMSCHDCRVIHRGLLELRRESAAIDAQPSTGPAVPRRRWAWYGGLAAAAVLVAAVLIYRPPQPSLDSDVTRSERAANAIDIVGPAANAVLTNRRFRWQPVAGADAYEIRVTAVDGERVWIARVTAASAELPPEIAIGRGAYYWQVSAQKERATLAASPLVPFRVD